VPRANRYLIPGKFYHLIRRCHNHPLLFKFARNRDQYRQSLCGMVYIDLNTVRARAVAHPAQWPRCSYGEWTGERRRYGVVDTKECLRILGGATLEKFRANYRGLIQARLAKDVLAREPQWTEGIAVGSRAFVEAIGQAVRRRQQLTSTPVGENAWMLREGTLPLIRNTA
jgi:hypothetical protein